MNRTVRLHLKSIRPECPDPDALVFQGGGTRPNNRFRTLCDLAGVAPKRSIESGEERPWVLKDLRKTCATYYDEHVPESSVEILGHSAGGITYRHYAHLPQRRYFVTIDSSVVGIVGLQRRRLRLRSSLPTDRQRSLCLLPCQEC